MDGLMNKSELLLRDGNAKLMKLIKSFLHAKIKEAEKLGEEKERERILSALDNVLKPKTTPKLITQIVEDVIDELKRFKEEI
jgi:hypothetical protein